jgi:hypothetical protein
MVGREKQMVPTNQTLGGGEFFVPIFRNLRVGEFSTLRRKHRLYPARKKKRNLWQLSPQEYRQKRNSENCHRGQHGENEGTIL